MSKLKNGLLAATFLLVACGQVAPGGSSADAKGTQAVDKKLELAGITIGMDVAQATAVLKSGGWNVKEEKGSDWDQEVNNELARQNVRGRHLDIYPKGVGALEATKGEERLWVPLHSAPAPLRGRVMKVQYTAPSAGQTPERALADLSLKYGAPDQIAPSGLAYGGVWCVAGASCAQGTGYGTRTVMRAKLASGSLEIILDEGRDSYDAWHAELLRATAAVLGPRGKPSY